MSLSALNQLKIRDCKGFDFVNKSANPQYNKIPLFYDSEKKELVLGGGEKITNHLCTLKEIIEMLEDNKENVIERAHPNVVGFFPQNLNGSAICVLDIDAHGEKSEMNETDKELYNAFESITYCETSMSGKGKHIIFSLPYEIDHRKLNVEYKGEKYEVFVPDSSNAFHVALTGNMISCVAKVNDISNQKKLKGFVESIENCLSNNKTNTNNNNSKRELFETEKDRKEWAHIQKDAKLFGIELNKAEYMVNLFKPIVPFNELKLESGNYRIKTKIFEKKYGFHTISIEADKLIYHVWGDDSKEIFKGGIVSAKKLIMSLDDETPVKKIENSVKIDTSIIPKEHIYHQFHAYLRSSSSVYPEYTFIGFLQMMSKLIGSKIQFELSFSPKPRKCNIYTCMLGYSTISHKSTVMDFSRELTDRVSNILYGTTDNQKSVEEQLATLDNNMSKKLSYVGDDATKEGLLQAIYDSGNKGCQWCDEAGQLLNSINKSTHMAVLRDAYCKLYDGSTIAMARSKRTSEKYADCEINEPYFSQWLITTFDSFTASVTGLDISSGWFNRMLFACPEYEQEEKFKVSISERNELSHEVCSKLCDIVQFIDNNDIINMIISEETVNYMDNWYNSKCKEFNKIESKLAYLGRAQIYVYKIAALFYACTDNFRDSNVIPQSYIEMAVSLIENYFFKSFEQMYNMVGQNPNTLQGRMIKTLKENGNEMSKREFKRKINANKVKSFNDCIEALMEWGIVNETEKTYFLCE